MPFWDKSRIPASYSSENKTAVGYNEYSGLMKHRTRSNITVKVNQDKYIKKLNSLFDISNARADEMIKK